MCVCSARLWQTDGGLWQARTGARTGERGGTACSIMTVHRTAHHAPTAHAQHEPAISFAESESASSCCVWCGVRGWSVCVGGVSCRLPRRGATSPVPREHGEEGREEARRLWVAAAAAVRRLSLNGRKRESTRATTTARREHEQRREETT